MPTVDEHEDLCNRCGRCCHQKVLYEDRVIALPAPCPYFNTETSLCEVYEKRFEVNPHCLSVSEGIERGVFPADCPYVRDIPNYVPPLEEPDKELMAGILEELMEEEFPDGQ